ncbi:MAG: DUF4173 domain-containing protein [Actinobacteria bacterium]|nr:DUF4173 domain-containing protein [Actinomycetota bacterium]
MTNPPGSDVPPPPPPPLGGGGGVLAPPPTWIAPAPPRPVGPRRVDLDVPRAGGRALAAAVVVGLAFDAAARNGIDTVSGLLLAVVGTQALAWSAPIRGRAARGALTLAVLASALLVLRASPWATAPLVLALALLAVLAASFDPDAPTRATFPALAGRIWVAAGHLVTAPAMFLPRSGEPRRPAGDVVARDRMAVARGIALSLPVVAVIGLLLADADPIFESWFDLPLLLGHGVLVGVGGWALLGMWRVANARRPEADLPAPPALGTTEAGVVLGALCALYAAFVAAQLVGVSSGSRHILESQGLTYAEYAREGFFQLLWAAAITVVVLLCVRACTGRARGALLWLSEAIVVLTLGVVASALRRLQLYEAAYGLTMLRLACTVVAVGIGAVFVLVGVAMARRDAAASGRLAPAVLAVALVFVAGWSLADPAALVAQRNLDRAAHGRPLDVAATVDLGPDAVPAIVERTGSLDADTAAELRAAVCAERDAWDLDAGGLATNASRTRAARLLDRYCATG